ncbi:Chitin synthase, class 5 [Sorochytrium milnesiophthora]
MTVQLVVGKIDAGVAILLTPDHHILEFPTLLLPADIASGSIIDVSVRRNTEAEQEETRAFQKLEATILAEFGDADPSPPVLAVKEVTHTSCTLMWHSGDAGKGEVVGVDVLRNGQRVHSIDDINTGDKKAIAGECVVEHLEQGYAYDFWLVVRTTTGVVKSNHTVVKTKGERMSPRNQSATDIAADNHPEAKESSPPLPPLPVLEDAQPETSAQEQEQEQEAPQQTPPDVTVQESAESEQTAASEELPRPSPVMAPLTVHNPWANSDPALNIPLPASPDAATRTFDVGATTPITSSKPPAVLTPEHLDGDVLDLSPPPSSEQSAQEKQSPETANTAVEPKSDEQSESTEAKAATWENVDLAHES